MINFSTFSTERLLDALPENRPLYKDSGLWQIRTDDMEGIYMQQNSNETFREFIIRYIEWLCEFTDEEISIVTNLLT